MHCFKAYDVRGRIPEELNPDIAHRIGRAYAHALRPSRVVVGRDVRLSSAELAEALVEGLVACGVQVYDIGVGGTEEVYFSTAHWSMDGGIMVTASHNPADYNGMKFVGLDARPVSGDSGLGEIERLAEANSFGAAVRPGSVQPLESRSAFIGHLLDSITVSDLKPLRIVVNAGNGGAGLVIDALEAHLPFEFVKIHHEADGRFPNGVPNPLLPENRAATADAVRAHDAALGVAWDGDFDRCFFFDEQGEFVEGYYLVGLLAEAALRKNPGETIIHDPRLTWNTIETVSRAGGIPVQSKTGHAFIKERMRRENAIYGGEMSGHHYFRDFAFCDSGMIPWLMVAELLSVTGKPLSALVGERMARFPCSGEINFTVADPATKIEAIVAEYGNTGARIDRTDGVSVEFDTWRFNLRASCTEPLLRLNVESRGDAELMRRKRDALTRRLTL